MEPSDRLPLPPNISYNEIRSLAVESEFIDEKGKLQSDSLRNWLQSNDTSVHVFSGLSSVNESTLRDIVRKKILVPGPDITRNILIALFGEGALAGKSVWNGSQPLSSHLVGSWNAYHLTHLDGKTVVARTDWEIEPNGRCTCIHRLHKDPVAYVGKARIEQKTVIIELELKHRPHGVDGNDLVWRFDFTKGVWDHVEHLGGAWFGLDYGDHICSGPLIMTKNPDLSDEDAMQHLGSVPVFFAETPRKNLISDYCSKDYMRSSLSKMAPEEKLQILTTFKPRELGDLEWLRKEAKKRSHPLRVEAIFMNPDCRDTVVARFHHRIDAKGQEFDEEISNYQDQIRRQAQAWKRLNSVQNLEVEIRFANAWKVGMGMKFGNEVIFISLMFARESAIDAPTIEIRERSSKAWQMFEEDFKTIWAGATPVD